MSELQLVVRETIDEAPLVKAIVLDSADGAPLPAFAPGSHVRVMLPQGGDRPYSLVDLPAYRAPATYVLGARLELDGSGGSRYMHSLKAGDRIATSRPIDNFPLHEGTHSALLFAGGIGITPILSMACALAASSRPFRLHYAGRSRGHLAFTGPLSEICGEALSIHYDDEPDTRLDIEAALSHAPTDAEIYVCGPAGMIDAVKATAAAKGFAPERVRFELFTPAPTGADAAFEVEVRSSGLVVAVPPGQSIIDALEMAGVEVVYDCRRGDCGICQCGVLEGIPDHRDVVLSDAERASNRVMQICVSRARSPRLVLDL